MLRSARSYAEGHSELEAKGMVRRHVPVDAWMLATGLALALSAAEVGADSSGPPICSGTLTYCRPCSASDDGQPMGCDGATPICETSEPNARFGYCVQCTSDANCSSTTPICTSAGPSTDTCRACSSDTDCSSHLAGTYCLTSGACSDSAPSDSSCSAGASPPHWLACLLALAVLRPRSPSRRLGSASFSLPPTL